ncbi:helix-turn-helix domain-containing protein [Neptuniibacter sp. SY11_33]|uniref:helix-turn-helix domain-containing protein n=1 Tax=Neptuniibacter sp. SY11_33 TaxID=3398215 RepID=UPI0039F582BE
MIVKKLRTDRNWSQEQLATMAGQSTRTIQRVESGQRASLETLKSLASVFEVDISTLIEEITVIDKTSENWEKQPRWFKFLFFGIRSRKMQLFFEFASFIAGLLILFFYPVKSVSAVFFVTAYVLGWSVRFGDTKNIW